MQKLFFPLFLAIAGCSCSNQSAPTVAPDAQAETEHENTWVAESNAAGLDLKAQCPRLSNIKNVQRAGVEGNKISGFTFSYAIISIGPETTLANIQQNASCKFTVSPDGKDVTAQPNNCIALCKEPEAEA